MAHANPYRLAMDVDALLLVYKQSIRDSGMGMHMNFSIMGVGKVPKSGRQVEAQYCLHTTTSYRGTRNFPSLKTRGDETAAEAAAVHQGRRKRVDGDMSSEYNDADNKNKYIITIIWFEE